MARQDDAQLTIDEFEAELEGDRMADFQDFRMEMTVPGETHTLDEWYEILDVWLVK